MKKDLFKVRLFSLAGLFGIMLALASCANEEVVQKATNTDNDKNLTSFMAGNPETRTSLDYNSGAFYWEAGDYIYVKDDNNVWQKSSNAPTERTAFFRYKVPGQFTNSSTYKVYYPGKNGNRDQVTIPTVQTQKDANSTAHLGESGDCGIADATGTIGGNIFSFKLDHQAAILVLQPYLGNNNQLISTYVTKIEVTSDNNITGTYTLNSSTGDLTGTGTGRQITLMTGGSSDYTNGFPLNNASASLTTNGAYIVIKPGTHTLTIKYTLKDVQSNVEGTISKTLASFTYDKNTYYDMTLNLAMTDYDANHYYMWDAQQQFWAGYEWTKKLPEGQPTLNGGRSENYPKNNTDSRWYNGTFLGYRVGFEAHTSYFQTLPNANEAAWYIMKGDPHWDDKLWTTMKHLYKGGMWFKKKSVLQAEGNYSTEHGPVGSTDLRTKYETISNNSITQSPPAAAVADNYFYLPVLGNYYGAGGGEQSFVGKYGYYWTSSSFPESLSLTQIYSWVLSYGNDGISLGYITRYMGMRAQPFSDFGDN